MQCLYDKQKPRYFVYIEKKKVYEELFDDKLCENIKKKINYYIYFYSIKIITTI